MRPVVPSLLVLALGLCACATGDPERHSPLAAAERVLALDFGPQRLARRMAGLQRPFAAAPSELRRLDTAIAAVPDPTTEAARLGAARDEARKLVAGEHARSPVQALAVVGTPDAWTRRLLEGMADVPYTLGLHRRPMSELDDRQHRTDPFDDRPEATWWQRVQRRLLLR